MYKVLKQEGLTQLEFMAVMDAYVPWSSPGRASGFDDATFPLMLDNAGVFYMYSAESYDVFLIDKKGRLVTKVPTLDYLPILELNKRLRKLHAE